jgi:glycosyltransferase involved in cell wall biosynthesis
MKKLKILYYIDYLDTIGGGATQSISSLNNLLEELSDHENILCLRNLDFYEKLRKDKEFEDFKIFKVIKHKNSIFDHIKYFIRLISNFKIALPSSIDKLAKENHIDLVVFLTPSHTVNYLTTTKFIYTIWDLCHLTDNQWPEMRYKFHDVKIENLLQNNLGRSSLILIDSDSNKKIIQERYRIDSKKIITFPFDSFNVLNESQLIMSDNHPLIDNRKYFIYPASFWPHKNHVRLIRAFEKFSEKNDDFKLVLTGKDEGQKKTIEKLIGELNLINKVILIDHLNHEDFTKIFRNSYGLVYPSFFGPTNIPPIEAWKLEVPVTCSNIMLNQIGEAGKLFNPSDQEEITESLHFLCVESNRANLIKKGKEQLKMLAQIRNNALKEIKYKIETEANL